MVAVQTLGLSRALQRVGSRPWFGSNGALVTLRVEQNTLYTWYAVLLVVEMGRANPLIQLV